MCREEHKRDGEQKTVCTVERQAIQESSSEEVRQDDEENVRTFTEEAE